MRVRWVLVLALVAAVGCGPLAPAPPATPRPLPPASSALCGEEITSDFVLGEDMACEGDALIVAADGIVLDLGGRTLRGPGIGEQTWPSPNLTAVGVKVQGHRDVTIRNGRIDLFTTNILLDDARDSTVEDIVSQRSRYGIYLFESENITVQRMVVRENIYGLHLQRSHGNTVLDNDLSLQTYNSPGGYGIYLFASNENRFVGNTIESNINWGLWFSDARRNVIYHNNIIGNAPQVSDSSRGIAGEGNVWHDADRKEGNYWDDYEGTDADGDGIGDVPYSVRGPGEQVDPYPFMERDGWQHKTSQTVDHYRPPPASARRDVLLVALAGDQVVTAAPGAASAASVATASAVALATDARTLYALSGSELRVLDAADGAVRGRYAMDLDGLLVAGRDGRSAIVVSSDGALKVDVERPDRRRYDYAGHARDVAPSWKHNILFVSTERGIDIFYIGQHGHVPYTIPLGRPGGALAMDRSGTRLYAIVAGTRTVAAIDTEQYGIVDTLALPWEPVALAVSPDERIVYAVGGQQVLAYDLASRTVVATARLSGMARDVAVSPNGDEVYVAVDGAEPGIAVVSAAVLRTTHVVRTEVAPTRILVALH